MKKIAIILILSLCICLCLSGCAEYADAWQKGVDKANANAAQKEKNNSAFEVVFRDNDRFSVVHDTLTDVLYLHDDTVNSGGLTVLLDTDGTPLLYSEWLALRGAEQ